MGNKQGIGIVIMKMIKWMRFFRILIILKMIKLINIIYFDFSNLSNIYYFYDGSCTGNSMKLSKSCLLYKQITNLKNTIIIINMKME